MSDSQKLDPWGKPIVETTSVELNKLRKEIITEGINKRSYESAEEESENEDSDNELLMKFIPKKNKKNGKVDFDSIAYAFTLVNKISKMRSELARNEERMRYLQLDYNNKEIKIEEQNILICNLQISIKLHAENDKKNNILITKQSKQFKLLIVFNGLLFFITIIQSIFIFI